MLFVKINKEETEIKIMKIPVKDFSIIPLLCPAGISNCAPCIYAKMSNVHNCPITAQMKEDFGFVECSYLDDFQIRLEKAKKESR